MPTNRKDMLQKGGNMWMMMLGESLMKRLVCMFFSIKKVWESTCSQFSLMKLTHIVRKLLLYSWKLMIRNLIKRKMFFWLSTRNKTKTIKFIFNLIELKLCPSSLKNWGKTSRKWGNSLKRWMRQKFKAKRCKKRK